MKTKEVRIQSLSAGIADRLGSGLFKRWDAMSRQFFERSIQNNFILNSLLKKLSAVELFTSKTRKQKQQKTTDYQILENRQVLSANFPAYVGGQLNLGDSQSTAPYELSDTFKLESNPSAKKTVYLDFNGHHSTGNAWKHSIHFPSYNTSGSAASFSKSELIEIQKIFQNVAEDFLPLDVNVTTRDPGATFLSRSTGGDQDYGIRIVVTQHTGSFGAGTGGLAKRNSFSDRRDTPAFVFNKGINDAAWTISHEAGHTMGLTHDGFNGKTYHPGSGSGETGWGPIMGGAFGKSLTQWSDGSYAGSDNRQDDLSVMTRSSIGIKLRTDDVGNSMGSAESLSLRNNRINDWGTITSRQDVDYYRFTVENSNVSFSVKPFQGHGNLDVIAKLYSSTGELISSSNPTDSVSASISQSLKKGTYYLAIDGAGRNGRYTDYGSLGFYSIKGSVSPQEVQTKVVGESGNIDLVDHRWRRIQLNGQFQNPVVIAGPATTNDPTASVVRVRNVNSNSFEIRIENWDYSPEAHGAESVGYLVVESGRHELADGTKLIAGNGYLNHRFRRIGFGEHFDNPPVVFSQVISTRGESTVTQRIQSVKTGSFETVLQEEEGNDKTHSFERFSWVAIEQVDSDVNDLLVKSGDIVNHKTKQLQFSKGFDNPPVFIANTQTRAGTDPATVRIHSLNHERATIFFQEETSADAETIHVPEQLGFLVIQPGRILGSNGEQSRDVNQRDQAFAELDNAYAHPHLDFAKLNSFQKTATNR